jgi:DNA-binding transcriptional LysR family regulator
MDRLEAMSILLTAVEAGSLSAAARRLGVPLATVSRKVADLEEHLKVRLLTRSSRHLGLTDAGRSYVVACRRILEAVSEAEKTASGEYTSPKGELVITAPIVFGRLHMLPIVGAFLRAYPDIDIRMVLSDRIVHLQDDHVDAALRIGELPDSSLMALRLGTVRHVVCASPTYLKARPAIRQPSDLIAHACITFNSSGTADEWSFKVDKVDELIQVRSRLVVTTAEAAIDAAVGGLGITRVLCYQISAARKAGLLDVILDDFERPPAPVNLVYPGQGQLPLKLRAFLDFAAPPLRQALLQ